LPSGSSVQVPIKSLIARKTPPPSAFDEAPPSFRGIEILDGLPLRLRAVHTLSPAIGRVKRRGRDLNPRRTQRPETVFETAAFDRSATPPTG
jgi:hypothetical protein